MRTADQIRAGFRRAFQLRQHWEAQWRDCYRYALPQREAVGQAGPQVDRLFDDYDVILTPTCPGEAEKGHAVGNNVFNRIWTAMHMPCLTIPSSQGKSA